MFLVEFLGALILVGFAFILAGLLVIAIVGGIAAVIFGLISVCVNAWADFLTGKK